MHVHLHVPQIGRLFMRRQTARLGGLRRCRRLRFKVRQPSRQCVHSLFSSSHSPTQDGGSLSPLRIRPTGLCLLAGPLLQERGRELGTFLFCSSQQQRYLQTDIAAAPRWERLGRIARSGSLDGAGKRLGRWRLDGSRHDMEIEGLHQIPLEK